MRRLDDDKFGSGQFNVSSGQSYIDSLNCRIITYCMGRSFSSAARTRRAYLLILICEI